MLVLSISFIVVGMKTGRGFMVRGGCAVFVVVPCKHCFIVMWRWMFGSGIRDDRTVQGADLAREGALNFFFEIFFLLCPRRLEFESKVMPH